MKVKKRSYWCSGLLLKSCSKKYCKFHKTGKHLRAYKFIKKKPRQKCFTESSTKIFRAGLLNKTCERVTPWCSSCYYCTTSCNKVSTQILRKFKCWSRCVGDLRWWESLTMLLAGNKGWKLFVGQSFPKNNSSSSLSSTLAFISNVSFRRFSYSNFSANYYTSLWSGLNMRVYFW